ncbi:hypothetical protein [Streptomyces uncialis]|uniref:Uncharacterized protein n=1 Tax=Streptomyces uncialis TaxID=1048205 RepID=A0A1Q4V0Z8_9ACTN|nr:hypothetical protein [Streptomyces uncialis]OKH91476.1 hypothetical protein AB852_28370 [Streptomyces uncialis]
MDRSHLTPAQPTPAQHQPRLDQPLYGQAARDLAQQIADDAIDTALAVARDTLTRYATPDIHNHPAMVEAATALRLAAQALVTALDNAAATR